jgi:amino acid transporter
LFGWAQLTVVLTGSIGAMAYAFADYAGTLWEMPDGTTAWLAAAAVVVLTAVNLLGVVAGKWVQNVLTAAKLAGLFGVVIAGLLWGEGQPLSAVQNTSDMAGVGLALVFVLYAYGGWNDAVFVAAEVRDVRRNLPRALILGIAGITVVYLALNAAYLGVLGFEGARQSATPAADVLARAVGPWGGRAITVLVIISTLGAINGMILAGSHVYATLGQDHRAFAALGRWSSRSAAPAAALVVQAAMALLLIVAVGTPQGCRAIDAALVGVGLWAVPWEDYFGGFETLVAGTAPVFWGFFLLTGVSLFVLRAKDGGRERPFRVPCYPLPPIVFCLTCCYMLYSSLAYAKLLALVGLVPLAVGLPLYWFSDRYREVPVLQRTPTR